MNEIPITTLGVILVLLIALSAFFSASETAMMALNPYRLKTLAGKGHRGAKLAAALLDQPERLLGTILLGNNLANVSAASITTIIAIRMFGDVAVAIATVALTIILLIFAEVPPKSVAARFPELIAFKAAFVLTPLVRLAYPIVRTINIAGTIVTSFFPKSTRTDELTADELRTVVRESGARIPVSHQQMLLRILDLEKITVGDIMIPRNAIEAIDLEDDWEEICNQLATAHHTRLPVYRGNLDNIVGTVHLRRILHLFESESDSDERGLDDLMPLVREPYFMPEDARVTEQLLALQDDRRQLGLVVDEYGDLKGLATLDDILEEIVGEFTANVPGISEDAHEDADGAFLVNGSANVRDLNRRMRWNLPTTGPKTLNGLILEILEDIPRPGTSIRLDNMVVEIVQTRGTSVSVVRLRNLDSISDPVDVAGVNTDMNESLNNNTDIKTGPDEG